MMLLMGKQAGFFGEKACTVNRLPRGECSVQGGVTTKRGRNAEASVDLKKRIEMQHRENARLQRKLMQAEKIIEVQKKVAELLGVILPSSR